MRREGRRRRRRRRRRHDGKERRETKRLEGVTLCRTWTVGKSSRNALLASVCDPAGMCRCSHLYIMFNLW